MRKLVMYVVILTFFSCDDGDLQIETIDFDSTSTINTCNTIEVAQENVSFKINGSEALILTLPANLLKNEATTEDITSSISESGPVILTYRTFSETVSTEYFCASIPPTTPLVLEEIVAKNGTVFIRTTTEDQGSTFLHQITLADTTFENSSKERITNLSIRSYGEITTRVEE